MKRALLAAAMFVAAIPVMASEADDVLDAAKRLAQERHEAFAKKDAAAVGRQFSDNGVFVLMQPTLLVQPGPQGVEDYFAKLFARGATDVGLRLTEARMLPDGRGAVWGEYDIAAGGKTVTGHIFEVLARENGAWKIMVHAIARPDLP